MPTTLMATSAIMTSASTAVISLIRSGTRPGIRRTFCQRWLSSGRNDITRCRYEAGSLSTYPTPRRVWISRGPLLSTLRRSTDT